MTRKQEIREAAITVSELLKGHTPEQIKSYDNALHTVVEFTNYIMELTAEPDTLSPTTVKEKALFSGAYVADMVSDGNGGIKLIPINKEEQDKKKNQGGTHESSERILEQADIIDEILEILKVGSKLDVLNRFTLHSRMEFGKDQDKIYEEVKEYFVKQSIIRRGINEIFADIQSRFTIIRKNT